MRSSASLILGITMFLVGCSGNGEESNDAGARRDAGVARPDSTVRLDGGDGEDGGPGEDGGGGDAGVEKDAAVGMDAAPGDGGVGMDAEPGDGGVGTDAGPEDAGSPDGAVSFVINELIHDFASPAGGADPGNELVEIAGPAGAALDDAELVLVASDGAVLQTIPLSGQMPADGLFVVASEAPGGGTNVANADLTVAFSLSDTAGGLQLVDDGAGGPVLLDAVGWGALPGNLMDQSRNLAALEGTPLPALQALAVPACWARNGADTGDNSADFRHDPSPTPGAANGADAFGVTRIQPDDGVAGVDTTIRIEGTDFTDAMTVELDGNALQGCAFVAVDALQCPAPYPAGGNGLPARVSLLVRARPEHGGEVTLPDAFTWTGAANETDAPEECDYCVLQYPPNTSTNAGAATEAIYGQIYEAGLTDATAGQAPGIIAELGFGPTGTDPRTSNAWVWSPTTFNIEAGNNDEYMGTITVDTPGTYLYTYRFSLDGGLTFSYADNGGAGSNASLDFDPADLGMLTVN